MDIRFASSAKRFLDAQMNNVRSKLVNDVVWLADNPHLLPDEAAITPYGIPTIVGKLFKDDFHRIIFTIDGQRLTVANVGLISEDPHLWRTPD